jgi:excinuclease ABC subunit A
VSDLPVDELLPWVEGLEFTPAEEAAIAATILKELTGRLGFLRDVGLGYLTPVPAGPDPLRG